MSHANAALTPQHRLKVARLVVDHGHSISETVSMFTHNRQTVGATLPCRRTDVGSLLASINQPEQDLAGSDETYHFPAHAKKARPTPARRTVRSSASYRPPRFGPVQTEPIVLHRQSHR